MLVFKSLTSLGGGSPTKTVPALVLQLFGFKVYLVCFLHLQLFNSVVVRGIYSLFSIYHLEGLLNHISLSPTPRASDFLDLRSGPMICISNRFLADSVAAGLVTTL